MMRANRDEGGMVTAELAACLPVLIVLLAVALSAVSVASARLRAQDAAREAARAAARAVHGDGSSGAAAAAAAGVQLAVTDTGATVRVTATLQAHLLVPFLPAVIVTEQAVAAREPP
jgi:Flp pilus assembly protein TadG